MTYSFKVEKINIEANLSEVSMGLKKLNELMSRDTLPNLWKYTDKLNEINSKRTQNSTMKRISGLLFISLGIFLLVPGIMNPKELLAPLVFGLIAILVGMKNLIKRETKNPFDKSAKLLLENINNYIDEKIVTVAFLYDRMEIPIIRLDNGKREDEVVTYSEFKYVIETKSIFLLVYNDRALVLEKNNLMPNKLDEFCEFISDKNTYIDLTKEII